MHAEKCPSDFDPPCNLDRNWCLPGSCLWGIILFDHSWLWSSASSFVHDGEAQAHSVLCFFPRILFCHADQFASPRICHRFHGWFWVFSSVASVGAWEGHLLPAALHLPAHSLPTLGNSPLTPTSLRKPCSLAPQSKAFTFTNTHLLVSPRLCLIGSLPLHRCHSTSPF